LQIAGRGGIAARALSLWRFFYLHRRHFATALLIELLQFLQNCRRSLCLPFGGLNRRLCQLNGGLLNGRTGLDQHIVRRLDDACIGGNDAVCTCVSGVRGDIRLKVQNCVYQCVGIGGFFACRHLNRV
jgi:hypothetical protein